MKDNVKDILRKMICHPFASLFMITVVIPVHISLCVVHDMCNNDTTLRWV